MMTSIITGALVKEVRKADVEEKILKNCSSFIVSVDYNTVENKKKGHIFIDFVLHKCSILPMNAGFTSVKIKSEAFRPLFIKCENDFEFIFLCLKNTLLMSLT